MVVDATGSIRATHPSGAYDQWRPYVDIFGSVVVLARVSDACGNDSGPTEGPGVRVHAIPDYHGLGDLIRSTPKIILSVWDVPLDGSLPVVRLPEPIAVILALRCALARVPYVAMVVADIQMFTHALTSGKAARASALLASGLRRSIGRLVRCATGVIFVTDETLQKLYPARTGAPVLSRSNVKLDGVSIATPRIHAPKTRKLIAVGSQQSSNKGHDIAIEALRILNRRDDRYCLNLVGAGKLQPDLRRQAEVAGIAGKVRFSGHLGTSADVRAELDQADLFVMPSRSEGLPRAMLEAMAAGLPAIGTNVGGIPELLSIDCLFPPDDADALAVCVENTFARPDLWVERSKTGVQRAHRAVLSTSTERLEQFFEKIVGVGTTP